MTSISDLLFEYFLTSTELIEVDLNPSRERVRSTYSLVRDMIAKDSYVPLFSIDKIKYVKNLTNTYTQLKDKAEVILKELGVDTKLPSPYKVAIVLPLSIVETWRKIVIDKIVFSKKVTIIKDQLNISPYSLLFLYRFVAISKFTGTGNGMIRSLSKILESPKNREILSVTYSELKKVAEYATSNEMKKNKSIQRKAYSMFNTLFSPLIFAYVLNGAGLARYFNNLMGNSHLAYTATSLVDLLGLYSFRVIYGYTQSALTSYAEELEGYFSVIHDILSSKDIKSVLKGGPLYSYLILKANEHNITDMSKISILWDLINNVIITILISLELCKNKGSCKDADDVLSVYKDKFGDLTIDEYVTRQYGLTY